MTRSVVVFIAALAANACTGSTEPQRYELVWEDEFVGPAGSLPNAANWKFDLGTDWGNGQLEYDTEETRLRDRRRQVSLPLDAGQLLCRW